MDWTEPLPVTSVARNEADDVEIESPDGILYYPGTAKLEVSADTDHIEYTGVSRAWITYWLYKTGSGGILIGDPAGTTLRCPLGDTSCFLAAGPWENDYIIKYQGFAVDMAGNVAEGEEREFLALKPFKLTSDMSDLYMTLGSYKVISISMSNRQNKAEEVVATLSGTHQYANFIELDEGGGETISEDGKSLQVTLAPKETRTFRIMVFTEDIGLDYNMHIHANSVTSPDDIKDDLDLQVRVVFPQEFPGMGLPAMAAAVLIALASYALLPRKRRF